VEMSKVSMKWQQSWETGNGALAIFSITMTKLKIIRTDGIQVKIQFYFTLFFRLDYKIEKKIVQRITKQVEQCILNDPHKINSLKSFVMEQWNLDSLYEIPIMDQIKLKVSNDI